MIWENVAQDKLSRGRTHGENSKSSWSPSLGWTEIRRPHVGDSKYLTRHGVRFSTTIKNSRDSAPAVGRWSQPTENLSDLAPLMGVNWRGKQRRSGYRCRDQRFEYPGNEVEDLPKMLLMWHLGIGQLCFEKGGSYHMTWGPQSGVPDNQRSSVPILQILKLLTKFKEKLDSVILMVACAQRDSLEKERLGYEQWHDKDISPKIVNYWLYY